VTGLTSAEARARLVTAGRNELQREEATPPWRILARQFASPVIALLGVAAVVAAGMGEWIDAAAIGAIVLLNGIVGFIQEYRAERAVLALRDMTAPRARVRRDGVVVVIPAAEVVPGDVVLVEEGDLVAADARVVHAHALRSNEAALTGESVPVDKEPGPGRGDRPLAERLDMLFAGTAVVHGTGEAEVLVTGMNTELGKVARLLATAEKAETPLQVRLGEVSKTLVKLSLGVVALVAILGALRGQPLFEVLLGAVSLAVAAVPEGLPAVVTIALAVGVQRMAQRNVLVRRLPAVETLGSATVVCTDKTGTLTTGRMTVRETWGPDHPGIFFAAAACNEADLDGASGDPTELALLAAARERGIERAAIERDYPRGEVNPFDSERKRMSIERGGTWYVKGAVDLLLPLCRAGTDGAAEANADMGARGLRVLAVARGNDGERDLDLLGLVGIADPPRTEAIEAVALARAAGIVPVMITGDHPATARAIATEMGILRPGEEIADRVHARVTPEDKLRIVRQWKERGAIVSMTGDGVNDAPALREAHIGIAMGKTGTEVTREAADMVLADDNFASIVAAIREGRAIFDNIRKTLVYLLSGNAAELLVMFGAAVVGLPVPLLPLHLLWINLVTDGLPALALVVEPPERDVLSRPPRPADQPMLGRPEWTRVVLTGAVEAACVLGVFAWTLAREDLDAARNMAFSTLVFSELFRSFAARSDTRIFWAVGAFSNLRLLGVVLLSALLQMALHHTPALQVIFRLQPLTLFDCLLSVGLALLPVTVIEVVKLARR